MGALSRGGEEFIVFIHDTGRNDAYSIAEKLRTHIQNNYLSDDIRGSVSIGFAQWHGLVQKWLVLLIQRFVWLKIPDDIV